MDQPVTTPSVSAISLDGPSVRLRPLTRADYGFLWRCRTHPEILYLWMHGRTLPSYEQYAQELDGFLSSQVLTMLLIETQSETPTPVGYIFAYDYNSFDHTAFVSLVIHPVFANTGWAAEAAVMFFNYIFAYFDLRKVSMEVFAFNQYLLNPLVQAGAQIEGRFIAQRYYQGNYHDVMRLAVLHDWWNQSAPALAQQFIFGPTAARAMQENSSSPLTELEAPDSVTDGAAEAVAPARRKSKRAAGSNGAAPAAPQE
jgi:diamine N-acetyltransferase